MFIIAILMFYLLIGIGLCIPIAAIYNDVDLVAGTIVLWPAVLLCYMIRIIKAFLREF